MHHGIQSNMSAKGYDQPSTTINSRMHIQLMIWGCPRVFMVYSNLWPSNNTKHDYQLRDFGWVACSGNQFSNKGMIQKPTAPILEEFNRHGVRMNRPFLVLVP